MRVGTFTLIKNEACWIRPHLLSWLPHVDQMVFFDGNSTDGTLEMIKDVSKNHPFGKRITLVEGKDPENLEDAYVRTFNECIKALNTDYGIFAHPDMILEDPGNIGFLGDAIAYTCAVRSFAGDPGGQMYEIKSGRADKWKNVYRLRNPDLGLHYFGHYGSVDEDCYFSKITGNVHEWYEDHSRYTYEIKDSGIKLSHFSDVRPLKRRVERMVKCLLNQGNSLEESLRIAAIHPRVTFKDGYTFKFEKVETPEYLREGVTA